VTPKAAPRRDGMRDHQKILGVERPRSGLESALERGSPRRRSEGLAVLFLATLALLAVLGCSEHLAAPKLPPAAAPERARLSAPRSSLPAQSGSPATSSSSAAETWAETNEFRLPIPAGYRNATAEFPGGGFSVVLAKNETPERYLSTIVIRRVPIPGGSFDDPSECEQTGHGLIHGGTDAPGTGGVLNSAQIIDGPVGKTCQIQLTAPQGVALLTELHQPGNSRFSPKDIWQLRGRGYPGTVSVSLRAFRISIS
jgi:hypothetical protein